jgi:hypothetical protein
MNLHMEAYISYLWLAMIEESWDAMSLNMHAKIKLCILQVGQCPEQKKHSCRTVGQCSYW